MGHKIFVSYKYHDNDVENITGNYYGCTARDYVDELDDLLSDENIYKGEDDNEDLSQLTEDSIWSKLKDRIYDSTLTIVLISPNMKESYKKERDQWIPWEISYSLKEVSRKDEKGNSVTSKTNAMLALVLPDREGAYSYYTYKNACCDTKCRTLRTDTLFAMLKDNMFNIKEPNKRTCDTGSTVYTGNSSYIESVNWIDFINDPKKYIDKAYERRDSIDDYTLFKEVE